MRVRGIIRTADLEERPPGSEMIEMVLHVQGVGPGQPRTLIIPYALLLEDATLDPDTLHGRSFAAEITRDTDGRWLVQGITVAGQFLREDEGG